MPLLFEPESHSYTSTDGSDISWLSVTTAVGMFKQPFDPQATSVKSSRNRSSKWYKMNPEDIRQAWKAESDRACNLGTWYHNQQEEDILRHSSLVRHNIELPVIAPSYDDRGRKIAPIQQLTPGIYPEHLVYLKSAGICGQSDLVEVADGLVNITDYKTNKEIKTTSYRNWEGISKKMKAPVSHLDDCHLNHYSLQLSLYMYMILKHNPKLRPGAMMIRHIQFEEEDQKDKFGYPITRLSENGEPIVKNIINYDIPYLSGEVRSMIMHVQDQKHLSKK